MAWKNDEANANKPKRDDLILLKQHGYVTHLVKVLNRQAEPEDSPNDWNLYRIVEVVWAIGSTNPPASARADSIFGYPVMLISGNAMNIEGLPQFKETWNSRCMSNPDSQTSKIQCLTIARLVMGGVAWDREDLAVELSI